MTGLLRHKNFLVVEGRLLAEGGQGQLTAEEWLYLYREIEDRLEDRQAVIFATLESRIRDLYPQAMVQKNHCCLT